MFEQEGYDLIGAAMEVYNEMGHGFLEEVYQECLEKELNKRGISFSAQDTIKLFYKGEMLQKKYKPDMITHDNIIVELKAIKKLGDNEYAQILNYLRATDKRVGYLINFGASDGLDWKRFVI